MMARIAVDFDGVIHKFSKDWHDGTIYDEPVEGALEAMQELAEQGHDLIIYTARMSGTQAGLQEAQIHRWMYEHTTSLHLVFPYMVRAKLAAEIYIDDHGYRFQDWRGTLEDLPKLVERRPSWASRFDSGYVADGLP